MLYDNLKKYRKYMLFFCDFIIWNLSFYFSFAVNHNSFSLIGYELDFLKSLVILNICFSLVFTLFRLYDRVWRYANIEDFFYAGIASVSANFLFCVGTLTLDLHLGVRTFVLLSMLSTFIMFMLRFVYRLDKMIGRQNHEGEPKKRMLIVGGGEAAVLMLSEFSKSQSNKYVPICIVDDDREKIGRRIAGVKVVGSTYEIPHICEDHQIEVILFAISAISVKDKKRILDICARTTLEVKIVPNICELVASSNGSLSEGIRQVEVEDLLGREPIIFETDKYGTYIKDQVVMVTGGGGSIGSELCRQIALLKPKNLIILDIYENNAYEIQQELIREHGKNLTFEVQIASIRDFKKLETLFLEKSIDVIFHAAAHKHVPLMETNPEEAVKNNVFGTLNLVTLADKYKVKKFVQISTDKAVNPTNVMGATKRICEMIVQNMDKHSSTKFVAVRFGNVLGSNGSVIPLFKEQIKEGGPITVTHPDIIRYFMTIPEAVSLVLTAGGLAEGGEIFVLDMGEPVKIKDLAENLIRLSGFIPDKDIEIKYTGLRPGEKLYEELLMSEEGITKTSNKKIYIGKPIEFDPVTFEKSLELLQLATQTNSKKDIQKVLIQMIPTFKYKVHKV
ncbi:MAG: UDP-N-acetyl-alpha-D-glucosamine C6 dehydratase [Eubacteriales bacterium SKADARSKE-1]|nr:UDP-N-acetyl-alpha-D-glucosamine C6 dehydratase [Eubacteriales bacterium SKADARSKE-1]